MIATFCHRAVDVLTCTSSTADEMFMDSNKDHLIIAKKIVKERLIKHRYHSIEEEGKHIKATLDPATMRFQVCWTDDGRVQFPALPGSGIGGDCPGRLFKRDGNWSEFIAIIDASNSDIKKDSNPIFVVPRSVIECKAKPHDGRMWYVNVEWFGRYLEAW